MPFSIDFPKATIDRASYLLKWSDRSGDVGAVDREDCVAHSHLAAEGGRPPVGNGIDNNPSSGRAPLVFLPTEDHADADRLTSVLTLLHGHNLAVSLTRGKERQTTTTPIQISEIRQPTLQFSWSSSSTSSSSSLGKRKKNVRGRGPGWQAAKRGGE
jgi:hypothetical protein